MNRILSLLATIFILSSTSVATAQESELPKFRVKVFVSADENIEGKIKSYINRELRSLGDVELVDDDSEFELEIVAIEQMTESGNKVGIVLSTVISTKYDNWYLLTLVPASKKEELDKQTANLYFFPDHWVKTGPTRSLRKLCNEIVADFDTKHLENIRKLERQYLDIIEKNKKSKP